ncbi:NAD(+) diphosphatase [Streptococcus cameli]
MKYCIECGRELVKQELEHEGLVPYCQMCNTYRFPQYNVAISALVFDKKEEEILLIQQYGHTRNILVAGYVSQGETLEATVKREVFEETNLEVTDLCFNASRFYAKNNVLMVNFACHILDKKKLSLNHEVDRAMWFTKEEAKEAIYPNSIAQEFLLSWLESNRLIAMNK